MSKKVYCIEDNKWYNSVFDAANRANVHHTTLGKKLLNSNNQKVEVNGLHFSLMDRKQWYRKHIKELCEMKKRKVKCIETGEIFDSAKAFCNHMSINYPTTCKKMNTEGSCKVEGKTYTFLDGKVAKVKNTVCDMPAKVVSEVSCTNQMPESNERTMLEDTLMSFIKKGMYTEASTLCEGMQKIYNKE